MEDSAISTPVQFSLYEATLNDLPEGVLWTKVEGSIIHLNTAAANMLGNTKEKLINQDFSSLIPESGFQSWLQTLSSELDGNHFKTMDRGLTIFALVSITIGQNKYRCFLFRKSGQPGRGPSEMLRIISEGTASFVGGDFFKSLAYHIIISTGLRYAIVTECANAAKTRVRTLVYIERDKYLDNFEYDIEGTPCEIVMTGENYYCPDDLDKFLAKEEGIKSYFGVPIFASNGEVVGHIAIFDSKPMTISHERLNVLKIFASRAGAEIERKVADEKLQIASGELKVLLKESEERFRDLFEEAPIAYVHEGLDSKFIKANRAAQ
jgi:PAS domain-containing protein